MINLYYGTEEALSEWPIYSPLWLIYLMFAVYCPVKQLKPYRWLYIHLHYTGDSLCVQHI